MAKKTKAKKPPFAEEHAANQDVCPMCGKDDGVAYSSPDLEDNQCETWGDCSNCNAVWIDVFVRSNTIVTEPEGFRDDL